MNTNEAAFMQMIEVEPFQYFVMTRHVKKDNEKRCIDHVDAAKARTVVEMLTLKPDQRSGFVPASKRFSAWKSSVFW